MNIVLTGDRRADVVNIVLLAVQFLLRHRAPSYVLPCPIMAAINDVVAIRKLVVKENFVKLAELAS